ncbi:MAG: hypothetical protein V4489_04045 [Chlamydiota bacterium]
MREDRFIGLRYAQDFFEPKKSKRNTHVVIVDPSKLKITVSPNRPLKLDATGTLEEVPDAERALIVPQEITIPFSFKNLRMLATYPLARKENGPVFSKNSWSEVFEQCNISSDQNRIIIMREGTVARDMPFNGKQG